MICFQAQIIVHCTVEGRLTTPARQQRNPICPYSVQLERRQLHCYIIACSKFQPRWWMECSSRVNSCQCLHALLAQLWLYTKSGSIQLDHWTFTSACTGKVYSRWINTFSKTHKTSLKKLVAFPMVSYGRLVNGFNERLVGSSPQNAVDWLLLLALVYELYWSLVGPESAVYAQKWLEFEPQWVCWVFPTMRNEKWEKKTLNVPYCTKTDCIYIFNRTF